MAEKSAHYPRATWEECMDFVKTVSSFNLKAVSYSEVAKKYGLSSSTTKSFTAKIGACKQFGLITTSGGSTIHLTETCRRLLFPTGEDTAPIARACFGMPPLYNKLIAMYDGKAIPNKEILANILMNDHNIQKSVKDSAAKVFIESAEQLGLIKGGILCYSDNEEEDEAVQLPEQTEEMPDMLSGAKTAVEQMGQFLGNYSVNSGPKDSDFITQAIPFESGKVARIIIPVDATEDDLLLLHDMFKVILKRKYKIEI